MGAHGGFDDSTDEALFFRVAEGDDGAFASFYDRHEAHWYGLVLRIVGDPAEAEDVLQEGAVLIWERARSFDPDHGRPAAWAATVIRNKAIDRVRARRRRGEAVARYAEADGEVEGAPATVSGLGERLEEDAAGIVRRTLVSLPAEQRQAIQMAFFGGLSQSEIAVQLGLPLGTVKARIRRGMLAMRDALEGVL